MATTRPETIQLSLMEEALLLSLLHQSQPCGLNDGPFLTWSQIAQNMTHTTMANGRIYTEDEIRDYYQFVLLPQHYSSIPAIGDEHEAIYASNNSSFSPEEEELLLDYVHISRQFGRWNNGNPNSQRIDWHEVAQNMTDNAWRRGINRYRVYNAREVMECYTELIVPRRRIRAQQNLEGYIQGSLEGELADLDEDIHTLF